MKCATRVAMAVGTGYVLGRRKKMRTAILLGAAATGGGAVADKLGGSLVGQAMSRGSKLLGSTDVLGKVSPQLSELTDVIRGDLLQAGRDAASTAMNSRIDSLTGRLHDRAELLRNPPAQEEGETDEPQDEAGPEAEAGAETAQRAPQPRQRPARQSATESDDQETPPRRRAPRQAPREGARRTGQAGERAASRTRRRPAESDGARAGSAARRTRRSA
ncbi:MAG TPA: hypothetical protein VG253_02145 [Streptosporangiaceae bacterium]|nr:hypothetical protein [Streptosporangiaceae bacterium]